MNTTQATTTSRAFDAETLRRAIEERDADTLLGLYAPDAELYVMDRNDQPSHPRIVRGRDAIGEYYADVCGRDMTHKLERLVVTGDHAAFIQDCGYPSGARVRCVAVLDLKDGLITRLSGVQVWDE
jgi:ketosteroid isomerase-like protein